MEYLFEIPIGDWSKDGHGKCEFYKYKSNKPIEEVRDAYFNAINILGKEYPTLICGEYEEYATNIEMVDELKSNGFEFKLGGFTTNGCCAFYITQENMLELIEWFIKCGDKEIKLERLDNQKLPMLPFYGFDENKRHIGFFGYGLFD